MARNFRRRSWVRCGDWLCWESPLAIVIFVGISLTLGYFLDWPVLKSVALGGIVSVASTMVLGRMLMERGLLKSEPGRITIGLSLVDDLSVVIMIVIFPVLGELTMERLYTLGWELGRAFLILLPVLFLSYRAIPWLLSRISRWENPEFLFLATVALSVFAAAFTQWLGLSLALGAFLAGVLVSHSPDGRQAVGQLDGLRDLCVAVFFVSVGALIDPGMIMQNPGQIVVIVLLVIVGKFVVWTFLIRVFGYPLGRSMQCASFLAQIGEFSFILGGVAWASGMLEQSDYNAILAAALFSIAANPWLIKLFNRPERA